MSNTQSRNCALSIHHTKKWTCMADAAIYARIRVDTASTAENSSSTQKMSAEEELCCITALVCGQIGQTAIRLKKCRRPQLQCTMFSCFLCRFHKQSTENMSYAKTAHSLHLENACNRQVFQAGSSVWVVSMSIHKPDNGPCMSYAVRAPLFGGHVFGGSEVIIHVLILVYFILLVPNLGLRDYRCDFGCSLHNKMGTSIRLQRVLQPYHPSWY